MSYPQPGWGPGQQPPARRGGTSSGVVIATIVGSCVYTAIAGSSLALAIIMALVAFALAGLALAAKLGKIKTPFASVSVWWVIVPALAGALSLVFGIGMANDRREAAERSVAEARSLAIRASIARNDAANEASRLRERAPSIVAEARAKLASAQQSLAQLQVRESAAISAEGAQLIAPLATLVPPLAETIELRTSFASLDGQLRPLLAFQTVLDQLQSTLDAPPEDVIAFDVAIERDVSALNAADETVRSRFLPRAQALIARATQTRRSIHRRVVSATAAQALEAARAQRCGPTPVLGVWDGELIGSESFLQRGAHDPGSIDVEHCTRPQLTNRCWVSTCDVRGRNAFGALVLNEYEFIIAHRQIISARRL